MFEKEELLCIKFSIFMKIFPFPSLFMKIIKKNMKKYNKKIIHFQKSTIFKINNFLNFIINMRMLYFYAYI